LERNEQPHKKGTRKCIMKLKKSIMKLKVQSGRKERKEKQENCSNIEEEQIITLDRNHQQQDLKKEQTIEAILWRGMNNTTKKNKKEHYEVESAEWKKRLKRKT
jgi:hypothetical protein